MRGRYDATVRLVDEANAQDPDRSEGEPAALLYGRRMSERLAAFEPNASEALRIACRAQHLERWKLPRASYPQTKAGYHAWRNEQKRRHGERVAGMMREAGYDEADAERVASLVRKEGLRRDAEAQTLEDVACLVFLQFYAEDFAATREEAQMVDIMRKTWRKMSEPAREAALELPLADGVRALAGKALAPDAAAETGAAAGPRS